MTPEQEAIVWDAERICCRLAMLPLSSRPREGDLVREQDGMRITIGRIEPNGDVVLAVTMPGKIERLSLKVDLG